MDKTKWYFPTLALCMYGFSKEMKPYESFLTPYLNSTYKNISARDISNQIYPVATYAYFFFLLLVFLLTDYLKYKPLIVVESLALIATRAILVWGQGIPIMKVMQVTYGLSGAAEIAYFSYVYAMVEVGRYQTVTGYTRAVVLFGKGLSGILGQILISTGMANYLHLNYISFGSACIAFLVSLALPKVDKNILAHHSTHTHIAHTEACTEIISSENKDKVSWKLFFLDMLVSFKKSYSNGQLLMWSVWWAFATCGGLQVRYYVMNLWLHIQGVNSKHVYNGAVFACGTLLSAFVVAMFSLVKIKWSVIGEALISAVSVVQATVLFVMAYTNNIWIAYMSFVIFRVSFALIVAVAR